MATLRSTRFWLALVAVIAAANACSVYDASLLEPAPSAGSGGGDPGGAPRSTGDDAAFGSGGAGVAGTNGSASGDSAAGGEAGTATGGTSGATASGGASGAAGAVCSPRQPVARVFGAPDGGAIALRAAVSEVDF